MGSWTQKYAPRRRSEVVGNDDSVNSIIAYLNIFRNKKLRSRLAKKALLLHGPPGIGKTSSVLAIANALNFDVVMVNASDKRNKKSLRSVRNASLFSSLKEDLISNVVGQFLLIDEVDGLSGTADRGGIREIISIINSSRVPIILTANDVSPQKFSSLRKYCELREFQSPTPNEILQILRRISDTESLSVSDEVLLTLIEKSQNDIRGSINSLQTLASGKNLITEEDLSILTHRDQSVQIREFLHTLFIEADGEKAYRQTRLLDDVDYSKILLILRDISARFVSQKDYDQLAQIYELLANADITLAHAQRERIWSQLAYFYTYITKELSTVISPIESFPKFPDWQLQIPSYWITLSRQRKGRKIAKKVGRVCKTSSQDAINYYFPYLRFIFNHNTDMSAYLALEFQLFDVEPGKRKTRLIWNGEIDYFSKNKQLNRDIKKKVREIYPKQKRIQEHEIDLQSLQKMKEQTKIQDDLSIQNEQKSKKESLTSSIKRKTVQKSKKSKKKGIKENQREKTKEDKKISSKKTLSDFFNSKK
ncbi:MAG: AAA family ATPase [Candidatus Hodarchaeota archaeon]